METLPMTSQLGHAIPWGIVWDVGAPLAVIVLLGAVLVPMFQWACREPN